MKLLSHVESPRKEQTLTASLHSRRNWLGSALLGAGTVLIAASLGSAVFAAVKKVAYPEVKVTVSPAYKPDAAFDKMRTAFANAVAKKNQDALFALVGPTFLWTSGGEISEDMDLGRDALYNFKVAFGFRGAGKDTDGGVEDGPYWGDLATFANNATYYANNESSSIVCGPIVGDADDEAMTQARKKIGDEDADWYFTIAATDVTKGPTDKTSVGNVGTIAMPALSTYPPEKEGKPTSHVEVLMPSGKSGWVPMSAVRPLSEDHLCYAKTASGDWKIVNLDQAGE